MSRSDTPRRSGRFWLTGQGDSRSFLLGFRSIRYQRCRVEDLLRHATLFGANRLLDIRQAVGNAFVTVDTGLPGIEPFLVHLCGAAALLGVIETMVVITTAAFALIGRLHPFPYRLCHFESICVELLGSIICANDFVIDVLR